MALVIFLLIPISSVICLFLRDSNNGRKLALNILLIANALIFLSPLIIAYSNTPPGESMWNENTGGGASIWLYFIVFPVTGIAQLILLILKAIYAAEPQ